MAIRQSCAASRCKVPAGSSLAIVGPTGSGKSTLVNLISRMYEAPEGSLLIDGRPVRDYPLAVLRRNIGMVPQETFLFSATIRENLAFGAPHASSGRTARSRRSRPHSPGVRGVSRRALKPWWASAASRSPADRSSARPSPAHCCAARPSSSSTTRWPAWTPTRKSASWAACAATPPASTTILISHRVSTVRNADQIAVLDHGRIVELGRHDELLALDGYYAGLYQKQQLEEELTVAG